MVILLKILLCKEPVLEYKKNVPHNQKGHPTLVTHVDLILQHCWESKISENLLEK